MTIRKLMLPALIVAALAACQAEERTTVVTETMAPVETASEPTPLPPAGWATGETSTPAPTATVADAETSTADLPPMMSSAKKPTPKTHTVDRDGTMHMPGGENAKQKCAMCHGADLKGGKMASTSCVDCHSEPTWKT